MALFKRYKRMGVQNKYADYFADKKAKGELRSALTLAQWTKAGKPMPKKRAAPKVKKYIKPRPKKKRTTRTKYVQYGLRKAGLSKEEITRMRD